MKIRQETPEIVRFSYRQEKGDGREQGGQDDRKREDGYGEMLPYGSCAWANFDFDTKEYNLSIASDCGYYGYGWTVTKSESFLELMARISSDYLLNKLGEESVVDWAATREAIEDAIEDLDYDEDEKGDAIAGLDTLEYDYQLTENIGATTVLIENWNEEHLRISDIYEYIRTDYTGDLKRIAQVFERFIQPEIRKYLRENK